MTNEEYSQLSILGERASPSKRLEVFPHNRPGQTTITFMTNELLCNCPVTEQPDYYQCTISYVAGGECIESKSLKLFLQTFRKEAHFAEALVHILRDAIVEACPTATNVVVDLTQQIRGGIMTNVVATGEAEDPEVKYLDMFTALTEMFPTRPNFKPQHIRGISPLDIIGGESHE